MPLWSDEHFKLIKEIADSLFKSGQKNVMIIGGETPWTGWGSFISPEDGTSFYEHSIFSTTRDTDGKFKCDFTAAQRYIDTFAEAGIKGPICLYGLMGLWQFPDFPRNQVKDAPENISIRYLDLADNCFKYIDTLEDLKQYYALVFDYFHQSQQFDRLRIACDEPDFRNPKVVETFKQSLALIRPVDPAIQIRIAVNREAGLDSFPPDQNDLSLSFPPCNQVCSAWLQSPRAHADLVYLQCARQTKHSPKESTN